MRLPGTSSSLHIAPPLPLYFVSSPPSSPLSSPLRPHMSTVRDQAFWEDIKEKVNAFRSDGFKDCENLKDYSPVQLKPSLTSVLHRVGVKFSPTDEDEGSKKSDVWVCLVDDCCKWKDEPRLIQLSASSSNNGTSHLTERHNIASQKTVSHKRNVSRLSKMMDISRDGFQDDPVRWWQVRASH